MGIIMGELCFDAPAKSFGEALPIGNGRLGAMVYGGCRGETIQLNQDSIWYGAPVDRINPDARGHLDEVRKLILSGEIGKAQELMRFAFSGTPQSERPYQPLANVELRYHGVSGDIKEYKRSLLLEDGEVQETYTYGEGAEQARIQKTYLASYPAGVLAVHMAAGQGQISFDALLRRGRFYEHSGKLDERTIYLDGTLGEGGIAFCLGMRADVTGGSLRVLGEHLLVRDAKEVTLYIACETSFYEQEYRNKVKERLDEADALGYAALQKEHRDDYQALFGRVQFHLSGDSEENRYAEDYFQYGRYLMISSSRPGSLPANLQGIWNDSMTPPWDSKYTININTEMNYWPAESCNLSECHLPLFEHLKRMHENGCRVAKEMYGCEGFVAHHNTDIWGDCAPQDIYPPASYWVMGGAWLCTHIWNHYLYTSDREFLKEYYPILHDAVLFFRDFLIEARGKLVTCPSVSPENTYVLENGTRGCVCAGASMDNQILRDLLQMYLKASAELGVQDDLTVRASEILKQIPEISVGRHGQIMEWMEDYEEAEPGHRHISQLYALHPSHQITADGTPELAKAASATLERRLAHGGGHTGWSRAWIVNLYARLGNGEAALENLKALWSRSTFPNRMDNHPLGGGFVFQIDGNFGATAAIAEMFLQANEERVLLLPTLPSAWAEGSIKGLAVPGGALADLSWSGGKLMDCTVRAARDYQGKFYYRGLCKQVSLQAGEEISLEFSGC